MLVWVIYDITDDKLRSSVSRICQDYGLYRVQKSVFLGDLNKNEWDSLAVECEDVIEDGDSVYVFPLCDDCFKKIKVIGDEFDMDLVTDEIQTKFF
jgi:CRISPR-associated protein Cas2